jgi:hypothetical protein
LKFSNPKMSSNPIESLIPRIDYLLMILMDLRMSVDCYRSSLGMIVVLSRLTSHEKTRS